MLSLNESLERLGANFGPAADVEVLEEYGARLGFNVPAPLRQLYELGDGAKLSSLPWEILDLEVAATTAAHVTIGTTVFLAWPFFVLGASAQDPVCAIVSGPGTGYIMQCRPNGSDRMIAPSLAAFFDWLTTSPSIQGFFDKDGPSPLFAGPTDYSTSRAALDLMVSAPFTSEEYEAKSLYDLVDSMVDDETYVDLFTREQIPIQNYVACILSRARKMSLELRVWLDEMYSL